MFTALSMMAIPETTRWSEPVMGPANPVDPGSRMLPAAWREESQKRLLDTNNCHAGLRQQQHQELPSPERQATFYHHC